MAQRNRNEQKLEELRAKRLAQLQKQSINHQVKETQKQLSEGDQLWNGAIKGMIGMMDAIIIPPKEEGEESFYQWNPNLFGQAYQMTGQATTLMSQLQPDKLEQLNNFLETEVIHDFTTLLAELRA